MVYEDVTPFVVTEILRIPNFRKVIFILAKQTQWINVHFGLGRIAASFANISEGHTRIIHIIHTPRKTCCDHFKAKIRSMYV
jgi:hypothetical protein